VPMSFLPPAGSAQQAEPFQACFTADGAYYPLPLDRRGISRTVPAGATLGWRVRVGRAEGEGKGVGGWFAPDAYHVAQVMLAERSPAKVMVPYLPESGPLTIDAGGIWEWGWQLNREAESNALVLLARPDDPFDADMLRADLIERFPAAGGGGELDVTAAANYVATKAPGALRFIVQTHEGRNPC
jgi:hypothetical protein